MQIRRSNQRGFADHGWLRSFHSFSFADYYDPSNMGFRALRVINEDRVEPGRGFPTHPHRDMEIITYVIDGALEHKDSMGTGSVVRPGDVQRMSAGTGVTHSEFNASKADPVHFLQIWILPDRPNLPPGYEQKTFSEAERSGTARLIASKDGREGSVTVQQDVNLYAAILAPQTSIEHVIPALRNLYLHVVRGEVDLSGTALAAGDAAMLSEAGTRRVTAKSAAEFLLFDLA